ncbi:hypothetical protein [Microvirga lotononidis]|uniref:DUF1236 domain-containing protein n=1 Tax=Microvirga lotononidis TaxID=864069 RepID=I4YZQ6_9HYPH|nr:hypothetical protein [Microvirga lotononidis]EIM29448.1 Protein of unknown function (DUF1236) [Microvirga lotononidis]WQO27233.1 hypothetical protein U0023_21715 [Microvirga lotononidis]
MRFPVNSSTRLMLVAGAALFSTVAVAQPLTFRVNPATGGGTSYPDLGYAVNPADLPAGVTPVGYTQDGWLKMPADNLHYVGPRYAEPSGVKLRHGSPVPDWIDTGAMQSVSVPGLSPGVRYVYFISPDQKIVVVDPQSRRVMRVMR